MPEVDTHELRAAARCLLQQPLLCAEQQPENFTLVRRHEQALDRWFTQRLGYRLSVSSSTARLFKNTVVPHRRALLTANASHRPFSQREYTLLILALAAVAAGPRVISLRDLIDDIRTAATDAEITLGSEAMDRRALVTALKWMINAGLAFELHEHIDRYEQDADADAILEIDPDRVGLLPLAVLGHAGTPEQLLDRSDRRVSTRQWMRAIMVEDPVLYREDLTEIEWTVLRRRIGDETSMLDEMFALELEARAEGVAAIDPTGRLSDQAFPATGTVSHAALLFVDLLLAAGGTLQKDQALLGLQSLIDEHKRHWSKQHVASAPQLLQRVLEKLVDMRLAVVEEGQVSVLPAAARFSVVHHDDVDGEASNPTATKNQASKKKQPKAARKTKTSNPEQDDGQQSLW